MHGFDNRQTDRQTAFSWLDRPEWMNGFIGIKNNWYTKVKKHLYVSKQLNYITYKIRLYTTYKTYKKCI